jgi:Zn-dependent protease/CBS domain-containing protein
VCDGTKFLAGAATETKGIYMRAIQLFRVAGVEVQLDWSVLIVFGLIVTSLGYRLFPAWHPDWTPPTLWFTALAAAVLFFVSVLLHELSHALVAQRSGIRVRRVTLFVFGGLAQIEREPDRWAVELRVAIAGPLTSLTIGLLCLALVSATGQFPEPAPATDADVPGMLARLGSAQTLLIWLGQVNLILAVFNLVPAFPLDGGRVLRAALWRFSGDLHRATRWASIIGQAFAWLFIAAGVGMILGLHVPLLGSGLVNGIWLAFIGWFLNNSALVSYRQLMTREALGGVTVSQVMLTRFDAVDPDMSVESLINEYVLRSGQRAFPAVRDGRLFGMVFLQDLSHLDSGARSSLRVRDVMMPIERLMALKPEDDAFDALRILLDGRVGQAPVVQDGRACWS